jgi:hypothetical protein
MRGEELEAEEKKMSATERQQNRFILGVLIAGVITYLVTSGNAALTIGVALVTGLIAAKFLK